MAGTLLAGLYRTKASVPTPIATVVTTTTARRPRENLGIGFGQRIVWEPSLGSSVQGSPAYNQQVGGSSPSAPTELTRDETHRELFMASNHKTVGPPGRAFDVKCDTSG